MFMDHPLDFSGITEMPTSCEICNDRTGEFKCTTCGRLICKRCCPAMSFSANGPCSFTCSICSQTNAVPAVGTLKKIGDEAFVWTGFRWLMTRASEFTPAPASKPFGEMTVRTIEV